MAILRRRSLLATALAAADSTSTAADDLDTTTLAASDTALIALCAKATTLDDQSISLANSTDGLNPRDPGIASAYDAALGLRADCRKLMVEAADVPAFSPIGLRAKAALALREVCSEDEPHMPLVLSVLRHVAGLQGS